MKINYFNETIQTFGGHFEFVKSSNTQGESS